MFPAQGTAIDHRGELHLVQARPLTAPFTNRTTGTPATAVGGDRLHHGIAAAPGHASGPATRADDTAADITGQVLLCRDLGPSAVPALDTKLRALHSHESQPITDRFGPMAEDLGRLWGRRSGARYAEAFTALPVLGRLPGVGHL